MIRTENFVPMVRVILLIFQNPYSISEPAAAHQHTSSDLHFNLESQIFILKDNNSYIVEEDLELTGENILISKLTSNDLQT